MYINASQGIIDLIHLTNTLKQKHTSNLHKWNFYTYSQELSGNINLTSNMMHDIILEC